MKTRLFWIVLLFLSSCEKFKKESDFRNYIRDQHPYSELIEIDLDPSEWCYRVNDTINGELWIYEGHRYSVYSYCFEDIVLP